MLRLELDGFNLASLGTHVKHMGHHAAEQTLAFDLRYHHVAVLVAVQRQLAGHFLGERIVNDAVLLGQMLTHEVVLLHFTQL